MRLALILTTVLLVVLTLVVLTRPSPEAVSFTEPPEAVSFTEPSEAVSFTMSTVAICEYGDSTYCHDEILVSCNDHEYIVSKDTKTAYCGDFEVAIPLITAAAVFDSSWIDPRA